MNVIIVFLSLTFAAQAASAENIDKVKTMKCTVTKANVRSSFIPPVPGDTISFGTWQTDIWELKFKGPGGRDSYATAPTMGRVDHSGLRTPDLRTFGAVEQQFAATEKVEHVLRLRSNGGNLTADYQQSFGSVCGTGATLGDSIQMDCVATELW